MGRRPAQVLFEIEPSDPWVGPVTIEKVSSQVSTSPPDRPTETPLSSFVLALVSFAVGKEFGGVTVRLNVAAAEVVVASATVNWNESGPLNPAFGV